MTKKIIIYKNDAVGDLVQSLDAINNIINFDKDNKIIIYLSERSENSNTSEPTKVLTFRM